MNRLSCFFSMIINPLLHTNANIVSTQVDRVDITQTRVASKDKQISYQL